MLGPLADCLAPAANRPATSFAHGPRRRRAWNIGLSIAAGAHDAPVFRVNGWAMTGEGIALPLPFPRSESRWLLPGRTSIQENRCSSRCDGCH